MGELDDMFGTARPDISLGGTPPAQLLERIDDAIRLAKAAEVAFQPCWPNALDYPADMITKALGDHAAHRDRVRDALRYLEGLRNEIAVQVEAKETKARRESFESAAERNAAIVDVVGERLGVDTGLLTIERIDEIAKAVGALVEAKLVEGVPQVSAIVPTKLGMPRPVDFFKIKLSIEESRHNWEPALPYVVADHGDHGAVAYYPNNVANPRLFPSMRALCDEVRIDKADLEPLTQEQAHARMKFLSETWPSKT